MTQWRSLLGQYLLEVTCADSSALLNLLANEQIRLQNVVFCSDLVLRITISKLDYKKFLELVQKKGASVRTVHKMGVYWVGKTVARRPVLLGLICFLLLLFCYLPSRVLFISVEGNREIPDNLIIEAAGECGLRFGATRKKIRSEVMKNNLLQKIPQLQWAGINTAGCTAVISVREKTDTEQVTDHENAVCSIVAARDGVIRDCTVYQGNPLCTVGQAVKVGQTLVSGYLDYGLVTKATRADAEIRALTYRQLELITPAATEIRGQVYDEKTSYSLQIGKKVIKLSKDSGNLDTTCVKIYLEEYVYLPGGFRLPVAIIKQTNRYYSKNAQTTTASDSEEWLTDSAQSYLQDLMVAGEVVNAQTQIEQYEDATCLYGKYACIEMIGQIKYEQTILRDDNNG